MSTPNTDWSTKAKNLQLLKQMLIAGKFTSAIEQRTYDVINPSTGKVLVQLPEAGREDVDRAVTAARKAFDTGVWSQMAPRDRKKKMVKLAELIEKHSEELALLDTISMGVPMNISLIGAQWAVKAFEWFGEAIDKLYGEVAPTDRTAFATITKEPIGVVGAILPWNWPVGLLAWKIPPALAAGNSIVFKPDEQSSLSALKVAELALQAGIPEGVFNVVTGGPKVGEAMGRHMDIDVIGFTGSVEVGKAFLKYSSESNMKPVWIESGGKSPNLLFADSENLEEAAKESAIAVFLNSGQLCCAGSRLIVEESVRDKVLEVIKAVGKSLTPADPLLPTTMLGPIAKKTQLEKVMSYVGTGQKEGAKLVAGGNRTSETGYFFEPTVFDRVNNDMRIAQEEIFGPVLSTITFRTEEEAIALANKSIYGLAASIWTNNLTRAYRVSRAIRAGGIAINCFASDAHDVTVPFGGYKQSGYGRDKSLHALEKYTQLKTTWIKL